MFEALAFPIEKVALPHPTLEGKMIPGRRAILRTDTNDVLNIVSARYQLVPHMNVFGAMNEAVGLLGIPVTGTKVSLGDKGGSAMVTWTLDRKLNIGPADDVNLTIIGKNSYNYMAMVGMELGAFRLVCSNGLRVGRVLHSKSKRHVPSLSVEVLLREMVEQINQTETVKKVWAGWDNIPYPAATLAAYLERRPEISKRLREEIVQYYQSQPDRVRMGLQPKFSGWEAYNTLTWAASHRIRTRSADRALVGQETMQIVANSFAQHELVN